jgi:hypothetical protein
VPSGITGPPAPICRVPVCLVPVCRLAHPRPGRDRADEILQGGVTAGDPLAAEPGFGLVSDRPAGRPAGIAKPPDDEVVQSEKPDRPHDEQGEPHYRHRTSTHGLSATKLGSHASRGRRPVTTRLIIVRS